MKSEGGGAYKGDRKAVKDDRYVKICDGEALKGNKEGRDKGSQGALRCGGEALKADEEELNDDGRHKE